MKKIIGKDVESAIAALEAVRSAAGLRPLTARRRAKKARLRYAKDAAEAFYPHTLKRPRRAAPQADAVAAEVFNAGTVEAPRDDLSTPDPDDEFLGVYPQSE